MGDYPERNDAKWAKTILEFIYWNIILVGMLMKKLFSFLPALSHKMFPVSLILSLNCFQQKILYDAY